MTVFEDGKVQYTQDQWKPHFLPLDAASGNLPRLNVLDLETGLGLEGVVILEAMVLQFLPK
jgi:hypothetical protein